MKKLLQLDFRLDELDYIILKLRHYPQNYEKRCHYFVYSVLAYRVTSFNFLPGCRTPENRS